MLQHCRLTCSENAFAYFTFIYMEILVSNYAGYSGTHPSHIIMYYIVSYCGRVPAVNAPGMHCSLRLIVQTLVFSRSYLHRQVFPPENLVVKGGTTWARNGQ